MKQIHRTLAFGLALALGTVVTAPAFAAGQTLTPSAHDTGMMQSSMHSDPMVGGAAMSPQRNIIQNAVKSKDHTTLVAAVKAAGLVDTLSGTGPFTVFAPTNEAFAALPAGTVDTLLKPENKATLTKVLTYHVVAGKYTSADLKNAVAAGNGSAVLKTVEGEPITVKGGGSDWTVTDAKGNVAHITIADVVQSNGVIFVIDKVLMP
jgi:uncharacterized surface protein with fasciclin (FAS1) repeats